MARYIDGVKEKSEPLNKDHLVNVDVKLRSRPKR